MPQLNENTSSNIHFFLDRTTATHPIEHHLVVRNTHHAAEANQSVSSPNEETFQAPERDGLSVHVLNQENLTDPDNSCFAVTGSPLMGGASSPLRSNPVLRVFPLHVRLGAASRIPSGTVRCRSRAKRRPSASQQMKSYNATH